MVRSDSRRQKQLAKKKAKRAARHQQISRVKSLGPAARIAAARDQIVDCLFNEDDLEEQGITNALISFRLPSGEIGVASFLVDTYCLGVKDVFGRLFLPADYREFLDSYRSKTDARDVKPANLRKLIDDAVAFARRCGQPPHPDFAKWSRVLEGIDPAQATKSYPMGRDGKPYYMAGPHESESRSRLILSRLNEHCGPGNFDYVVALDHDLWSALDDLSDGEVMDRLNDSDIGLEDLDDEDDATA